MIEARHEFMEAAIQEAVAARACGDYAIGAVIVRNNEILVRAMNRSKIDCDATQHAEIVAIREASKKLNSRYLEDCILYTTHEPCPMCASAVVWAKMKGVISGARMEDMIAYARDNSNPVWQWRTIGISAQEILTKGNPRVELVEDCMRDECARLFHND